MRQAYAVISTDQGFIVGRITDGIQGYVPEPKFGTFSDQQAAWRKVYDLNYRQGLLPLDAAQILVNSLEGKPDIPPSTALENIIMFIDCADKDKILAKLGMSPAVWEESIRILDDFINDE